MSEWLEESTEVDKMMGWEVREKEDGQELVPQRREGALKQEFPCTGKLPHRWAERGAAKSCKTRQSRVLEGSKQRKLYFSVC